MSESKHYHSSKYHSHDASKLESNLSDFEHGASYLDSFAHNMDSDDELDQLKKGANKLKTMARKLKGETQDTIRGLEKKIVHTSRENEKLKHDLETDDNKIKTYKHQFDEIKREVVNLKQSVKHVLHKTDEKFEALEKFERAERAKEVQRLKALAEELGTEVGHGLAQIAAQQQQQIAELNQINDEQNKKIDDLECINRKIVKVLKKNLGSIQALDQENKQLSQKMELICKKLEKVDNETKKLDTNLDHAVAKIDKLESTDKKLEKEIDATNKKVDSTARKTDKLEVIGHKLCDGLDASNKKVDKLEVLNRKLCIKFDEQMSSVYNKIEKLNDDLDNTNKQIDKLNHEIECRDEKLEKLEREIKRCRK